MYPSADTLKNNIAQENSVAKKRSFETEMGTTNDPMEVEDFGQTLTLTCTPSYHVSTHSKEEVEEESCANEEHSPKKRKLELG
jgi:hypothetical protein